MVRRWLLVLLVIAFVAVVLSRLTEIEHLAATLRQGLWPWVLAAAFLQGMYYATFAALFVDDAARRGQSPARALAGTLLVRVADACAFAAVLVVGLIHLFLRHHLKPYEITGAVLLLLGTAGLAGVLMLGLWHPARLRRGLGWIERAALRLAPAPDTPEARLGRAERG